MDGTTISGGRAHIFAVAETSSANPSPSSLTPPGADPHPLPLGERRHAGRNHLNEEITPHPLHWDWRAIQPNHIKFRTWSTLAPM
jgi:hypothetical protein